MKYGESTFDIIYLLFAIISGIVILVKRRDVVGKLMGSSALILGCGDDLFVAPNNLPYFNLSATGKSLVHRRGLRFLGLPQKYPIHCNWTINCDYLFQDSRGKSSFQTNVALC